MIARTDQERLYAEQLGREALERQRRAAATRCKSCSAPICWAQRRGARPGKPMPVDYDEHEGGNIALYPNGTYDVVDQTAPLPPGTTRHYSHFATCPDAKKWRH